MSAATDTVKSEREISDIICNFLIATRGSALRLAQKNRPPLNQDLLSPHYEPRVTLAFHFDDGFVAPALWESCVTDKWAGITAISASIGCELPDRDINACPSLAHFFLQTAASALPGRPHG